MSKLVLKLMLKLTVSKLGFVTTKLTDEGLRLGLLNFIFSSLSNLSYFMKLSLHPLRFLSFRETFGFHLRRLQSDATTIR